MSEHEAKHQAGIVVRPLDEIVAETLEEIRTRPPEPELPTGIPMLDQAIWGLHKAEVTVISARPGEGKTTLSLQIAKNLADMNKKVMFLSLEMTTHQLVERLLVQFTQVSAWSLRTGDGQEVANFFQRVQPFMPAFKKMPLRIIDDLGKEINEIKTLLTRLEDDGIGAPDVLIIDYIQLIRDERTTVRADAIGAYLGDLRDIAKKYNISILICSQLNRDTGKNAKCRPRLSNLKSSGSIEEIADCVLMCWWEELGDEDKPEGYKYWILVEKQRFGTPGMAIPVYFEKEKLTFHGKKDSVTDWYVNDEKDKL